MRLAFIFDDHILQHEPLGAMYIASLVRQHGHEVEYFSADEPGFESMLRHFDPQVLAYSIATGQQPRFISLNQSLRESLPNVSLSVFGGPHPTFFPDMIRFDGVDVICIGEGEMPTLELLDALEKGEDYSKIENLHVKLPDGEVVVNKKRDFLPHLDELPFPDHDIKLRFPHLLHNKMGFFIAGRGCPFHCTFCFNDAMMTLQGGKYVRFRDPEKVCDEIELVKTKYDIHVVSFQDDIFGIDARWLVKFAPIYRRRIRLPFQCHYRADLVSTKSIDAMYEAGCVRLVVGLESGDPELRQRVLDKRVTDEELLYAAQKCHEYGIEFLTQNMFGIPGETPDTALSTIECNIKLKTDLFIHYFFTPYPMTKLGELAKEMGLFDGDFDALPLSYHSRMSLNMPHRDVIEAIGLSANFLIDYPELFFATKRFFSLVKSDKLRVAWLKGLRGLDRKFSAMDRRRPSHAYRNPPRTWPFSDDPPAETSAEVQNLLQAETTREPHMRSHTGFGIAPNLSELERD